jgi:hypothetical protein
MVLNWNFNKKYISFLIYSFFRNFQEESTRIQPRINFYGLLSLSFINQLNKEVKVEVFEVQV